MKVYRYADLDVTRTFAFLLKYAGLPERPGPDIIYSICEDKAFCERHREALLSFFKSLRDLVPPTSQYFRSGMVFIQEQFGADRLFEFVTDYCRTKSDSDYYPMQLRYYEPPMTYELRCQLFLSFSSWLTSCSYFLKEYIRKGLIQFFVPPLPAEGNQEDALIFEAAFRDMIDKATTSTEIETTSIAIQAYYPYNRQTLMLQCSLIERVVTEKLSSPSLEKLLGEEFVDNREVSKSGSLGQPYIQDFYKEKFLKDFLASEHLSVTTTELLNGCLITVQQDIKSATHSPNWT